MSFPAYPEYKDSGLHWIDRIPSHWALKKVAWHLPYETGWTPPTERQELYDGDRPWVTIADMDVSVVTNTKSKISQQAVEERGGQLVPCGSFLFSFKLTVGQTAFLGTPAYINEAIAAFEPNREIDLKFWSYAATQIIPRYARENIYGAAILNQDLIGSARFYVPLLPEQRQIADFLDHETARIDALIEEQQRLVALLKEDLHTSLVDSVTKGLNPIAPKRETEISDLPTIPEHWRLTKAKFLIREFEQGWSPQCENTPARDDSDWAVLKVGAVNGGVFRPNENKRLPEELEGISRLTVRAGDLLVSRANTRELVGSAAVVERDHDHLMVSDKLYRIRVNETACVPAFLSAYLQTEHPRREIEFEATGASSSMLNIGQDVVRELLVPTPPIDEQKEIVDWIAERQHQYETLMHTANRSIELLRERRQATISAAVTGKIDLRNWVQRMSSDERELPCAAEEGASYG